MHFYNVRETASVMGMRALYRRSNVDLNIAPPTVLWVCVVNGSVSIFYSRSKLKIMSSCSAAWVLQGSIVTSVL